MESRELLIRLCKTCRCRLHGHGLVGLPVAAAIAEANIPFSTRTRTSYDNLKLTNTLTNYSKPGQVHQFSYSPDTSTSFYLPIQHSMKLVRRPMASEDKTYEHHQKPSL